MHLIHVGRPALVMEKYGIQMERLRFRFSLPPGTYATVLMREFMQAKASQY